MKLSGPSLFEPHGRGPVAALLLGAGAVELAWGPGGRLWGGGRAPCWPPLLPFLPVPPFVARPQAHPLGQPRRPPSTDSNDDGEFQYYSLIYLQLDRKCEI